MIHDDELRRLREVGSVEQAILGIGMLLYGREGSRFQEFRTGFLEGLTAYETGTWCQYQGVSPRAMGWNTSAVWSER